MTTRARSLVAVLALFGASLGVIGCNETSSPASQPEAVAEQGAAARQVAPEARQAPVAQDDKKAPAEDGEGCEHHKGRGPGGPEAHGKHGPAMLFHAALRELDLTAEQKTAIEAAIAKLPRGPEGHPGEHGPDESMRASLAQAIRAGKVDPAALSLDKKMPDFAAHKAAFAEAAQTLHKTLTKEQRRALVDAIQKRADEHGFGKHGKFGKPGEPGEPGKPGEQGERGRHGKMGKMMGKMGMGPMGFLLRDLDLTDKQEEAIKQALEASKPAGRPDPAAFEKHMEEMRSTMKNRLESFASDSFDAGAFAEPPAKPAHGMKHPGEHMAQTLAAVVPILDSAQREKLAQRIESGPMFPGHHGGPRGR